MAGGYEVRQARVEDWPLIKTFIDRAYGAGAPFKHERRWRWQFLDTPYGAEPCGKAPVWIAVKDGTVAGQIALQPGRVWLDGEALPAGWIVDVMIAPEHRGQGLGHKIHDTLKATGRTLVTLTMAEATRRIAEKAGCVTLGPVRQMVRVGRLSGRTVTDVTTPIFERRPKLATLGRAFTRSRIAPAAAAALGSAAAAVQRVALPRTPGANIQAIEAIDPAVADRLFAREVAAIPALWDRGGEFWTWRFNRVPDLRYSRAALVRGDAVEGLVVWRLPEPIELNVGTLTDILTDPGDADAIEALAAHAVRAMSPHTEAIVAGASHPAHVRALSRLGFVTVKTHYPTVVTADAALASQYAARKDCWHFTKADHDWDQVHPVEH